MGVRLGFRCYGKTVVSERQQPAAVNRTEGIPTVRDERGTCGNLGHSRGSTETHSENAEAAMPSLLVAGAVFLPDAVGLMSRLCHRISAMWRFVPGSSHFFSDNLTSVHKTLAY